MSAAKPVQFRCAIYTRKSSEEGLDQDFNSLDSQRESCAAYIASQAGEGWRPLRDLYDDGGFSGGTMERPGLNRLLEAVDRGEIDIIVVYKVDRLTRSLADFARIVERLEAKNASFVSVTQAFNTTTSMGRLTLNVLLSFAQFEREVTRERIRDKIAASKAKGLWMGGIPPFGYDPNGRTLTVNPPEAELVRTIYARYLELGSVYDLKADLAARGIRSKIWVTAKGRSLGGATFDRGALYHLLRNRLYRGEIVHRDKIYQGQHEAILDAALFDAVQSRLQANANIRRQRPVRAGGSPLTGLVFDSADLLMSPTHAGGRSGKPHRYYVSKALLTGGQDNVGAIGRVPAAAIENLIEDRLSLLMPTGSWNWSEARGLIERIQIGGRTVEMLFSAAAGLDPAALQERLDARDVLKFEGDRIRLCVPVRMKLRGGATRMLDETGRLAVESARTNPVLIGAVALAHSWRRRLRDGDCASLSELAAAEGITEAAVRQRLPLAFLSPEMTRAILDGREPPGLSLETLLKAEFPLDWRIQGRLFSPDHGRI